MRSSTTSASTLACTSAGEPACGPSSGFGVSRCRRSRTSTQGPAFAASAHAARNACLASARRLPATEPQSIQTWCHVARAAAIVSSQADLTCDSRQHIRQHQRLTDDAAVCTSVRTAWHSARTNDVLPLPSGPTTSSPPLGKGGGDVVAVLAAPVVPADTGGDRCVAPDSRSRAAPTDKLSVNHVSAVDDFAVKPGKSARVGPCQYGSCMVQTRQATTTWPQVGTVATVPHELRATARARAHTTRTSIALASSARMTSELADGAGEPLRLTSIHVSAYVQKVVGGSGAAGDSAASRNMSSRLVEQARLIRACTTPPRAPTPLRYAPLAPNPSHDRIPLAASAREPSASPRSK